MVHSDLSRQRGTCGYWEESNRLTQDRPPPGEDLQLSEPLEPWPGVLHRNQGQAGSGTMSCIFYSLVGGLSVVLHA